MAKDVLPARTRGFVFVCFGVVWIAIGLGQTLKPLLADALHWWSLLLTTSSIGVGTTFLVCGVLVVRQGDAPR